MSERIPKKVYKDCTRLAKSYYDLIEQRRQIEKEILYGSSGPSDGMPHGSGAGNPTALKAEKLIREKEQVDLVLQVNKNFLCVMSISPLTFGNFCSII